MPIKTIKPLLVCLCAMGMAVFSQGCSKKATPPEWTWIYTPTPVDSISVGQVDSTGAGFIARVTWHDGCGEFSHNVITHNGNTYSVTVIVKVNTGQYCNQVVTSLS